MKFRLLGALMLAVVASAASAQDELRAAAERYVRLPATQSMFDYMFGPGFFDQILAVTGGDKIPADMRQDVIAIATEELGRTRQAIEEAMIAAAAETFTVEELDAMTAFYGSGPGASVMVKLQPFNNAYMARIGPQMQLMQGNIESRIRALGRQ